MIVQTFRSGREYYNRQCWKTNMILNAVYYIKKKQCFKNQKYSTICRVFSVAFRAPASVLKIMEFFLYNEREANSRHRLIDQLKTRKLQELAYRKLHSVRNIILWKNCCRN